MAMFRPPNWHDQGRKHPPQRRSSPVPSSTHNPQTHLLASHFLSDLSTEDNENGDLYASYMTTPRSTDATDDERYDVELLGINDGTFIPIHVTAIITISLSFLCAITVVVSSFKHKTKNRKPFIKWTKSERCVVYVALCDGIFNVIHFIDHIQMIATEDHVRPIELCELYAFLIIEFILAKNILVTIVAFNAYLLIRHQIMFDFGQKDWKILLVMFGLPFPMLCVLALFDQLGPAGVFCSFKTGLASILMTAIPYSLLLVLNSVLYGATLYHVGSNTRRIQHVIGKQAQSAKGYTKAAKTMSMFALAFLLQWSFICVYSIWQIITDPPMVIFFMVVIFTNLGGVFNFVIFVVIKRGNNRTEPQLIKDREEDVTRRAFERQMDAERTTTAIQKNTTELSQRSCLEGFPKVRKGKANARTIGINITIKTENTNVISNIIVN